MGAHSKNALIFVRSTRMTIVAQMGKLAAVRAVVTLRLRRGAAKYLLTAASTL